MSETSKNISIPSDIKTEDDIEKLIRPRLKEKPIEFKLNIALFAVIIPIITLIETWVDVEWISIILPSIFVYYLTFILSRLARKSLSIKNAIGYIGYTYSFLLVIFDSNPYVLAYSFIILIISLLIGYFDKTYNALFKVSVLGTIVFVL